MNLATFLEHWRLTENPFRAEEARQDPVFLRLEERSVAPSPARDSENQEAGAASPGQWVAPPLSTTAHSEFEKIAGDFEHPSTAIVFGEKGSGKTAIRMQLADRIAAFNRLRATSRPESGRVFLIPYDDLNPILARFVERVGVEKRSTVTETLAKLRLVDHIDALLGQVVPVIVDAVLGDGPHSSVMPVHEFVPSPPARNALRKAARRWERSARTDLLVLQAVYDGPGGAARTGGLAAFGGASGSTPERRTRRLRHALRLPTSLWHVFWSVLAIAGWIPAAATAYYAWQKGLLEINPSQLTPFDSVVWIIAALLGIYVLVLIKRSIWDRVRFITLGHRIRRQVRTSTRSDASFARSLRQLDPGLLDPTVLPMTGADDVRYAMLERLRRVLRSLGYSSVVVIVDRVDEPTLISGDPDRMRAAIWPLLNNKFLQLPWLGVKMLLPMELRHALFRESAAFFQEARLDKQNLIERLSWTGQMLYDLCNARLQACRQPGAGPVALLDLFAEDVTRQDLIEALDQMHQPRDAFKMLYQCFTEHAASQTTDQPAFRVPRLILDMVRKGQVERVKQLYKGVRPA